MEATQRRYLEGFFAGLQARDAGATVGGDNGRHGKAMPPPADPWRVLLVCAASDRPPRAEDRATLATLGVEDLAPEGRDGCRLRLRTSGGRLRAWQLRELAAVSQECAGGFIEVGADGGLELAVVGWREAAGALARLRTVGISGGAEVVWRSPAAGLDAEEFFDVTALARTLEAALVAGDGPRVTLDGGARGWAAVTGTGDGLNLRAVAGEGGGMAFQVSAGGGGCWRLPAGQEAVAVLLLVGEFHRHGGWEALDLGELREALDGNLTEVTAVPARVDPGLWPGTFPQKHPGFRALVGAPPGDGLWRSRVLGGLAELTEGEGAGEARLWSGGVVVPGVAEGRAEGGLRRLAEVISLVR